MRCWVQVPAATKTGNGGGAKFRPLIAVIPHDHLQYAGTILSIELSKAIDSFTSKCNWTARAIFGALPRSGIVALVLMELPRLPSRGGA
jgi:hypothetical protein